MTSSNTLDRLLCKRNPGLLAVLVTALSVSSAFGQDASDSNKVRATVVTPERRTITRDLQVPGSLTADERVDLYAKLSGYVSNIELDIGDRVKKGDVLVTISIPEMKDEVRSAAAVLTAKEAHVRALQAKSSQAQRMVETARAEVQRQAAQYELDAANLARRQELHDGHAIPEQALDEARSAAAVSQAQLRIAEAQVAGAEAAKQADDADVQVARANVLVAEAHIAGLQTLMQYTSIRAPFDGVITARNVDHGAFVRSAAEGMTAPLLRIENTDRIRVVVHVPETDAPHVHVGTKTMVDVKALGGDALAAVVSRTAGAINPSTRTLRVEIDIENHENRFIPGMYALVELRLETMAQAMVIPSKAIRIQDKETVVFVAANGITHSIPIKIGYDDGIWAEVTSGLSGSEQVITSTNSALEPGLPVSITSSGSG